MSAHNVGIVADALFEDLAFDDAELLYLPGGMPGAANLNQHTGLSGLIMQHYAAGKPLAAICAAPMVYGNLGLLEGLKATCYPGFEEALTGAEVTGRECLVCRRLTREFEGRTSAPHRRSKLNIIRIV